jgi:large subunit ribosomal protein L13
MQTTTKPSVTLVNAEGLIVGRMCSKVAKRLLNGEEVITQRGKSVFRANAKAKSPKPTLPQWRSERGPFHYRRPDRFKTNERHAHSSNQRQNAHKRLKAWVYP